jgi:threonine/homoserine/homoserine lactone efflux protein
MQTVTQLWLFFLVVLAVVVLPGMDMAYIAGSSLVGGRRQGLLALTGVVAGGICHVLAAALGVGLLLQLVPGLFNAVLFVGAGYLGWIAWTLLRSRDAAALQADAPRLTPRAAVLRGALTSLLNPKAYLFMLAVFPQFIDPQRGPVWLQALLLWLIIAATQALIYGPLALAAAGARQWFAQRPAAGLRLNRIVGAVLLLTALWTAAAGWRGH